MLDHVGDVHLLAGDPGFRQTPVQHPTRRAHEGVALNVLPVPGLLAHQHHLGPAGALPHHGLRGPRPEVAGPTLLDRSAQAPERRPVRDGGWRMVLPRDCHATGAGAARRSRRVRACPASRLPAARRSARRALRAMMVSAGLAEPCVGITLPSAMNRFGIPHTRWSESTTLRSGSLPIRHPPTRWAYRSMTSTSWAPAASKMLCRVCLPKAMFLRSLSHWVYSIRATGSPR